jgi:hypothetical protein
MRCGSFQNGLKELAISHWPHGRHGIKDTEAFILANWDW